MEKTTTYSRRGLNRPLNRFGRWCVERGFDGRAVAAQLGIAPGQAWQYMIPLDHARFTMPRTPMMQRIFAWTGGEIEPQHFYDVEAWRAALARSAREHAA